VKRLLASLLLVVSVAGCRCTETSSTGSSAPSAQPLTPLPGPVRLELSAKGETGTTSSAALNVPVGATRPRPIVMLLAANAERECTSVYGAFERRVFVFCPKLELPAVDAGRVDRRGPLRALLRELKQKFTAHVASGSVALIGVGKYTEDVLGLVREEPSFFSRVVLVDGGYERFSSAEASLFSSRGGKKLLFVCGTQACRVQAGHVSVIAQRSDVDAKVSDYDAANSPELGKMLAPNLAWLLADDARWAP
jgi:hypothetical protein